MQEPVAQNQNFLLVIAIVFADHIHFRQFTVRHGNYCVTNLRFTRFRDKGMFTLPRGQFN
jgi:hypothetical protein